MNFKNFALAAGALLLGLAVVNVSQAQGPLYDKVMVNMPYTVTVGDRVLQPGDYVIRQLPSAGGASRVLLIYSDNGMKFETSAMTIPALDNRTPDDTKVVLHHFGSDYYFDKIWVQGKDYGYEFPLPDAVKARMRERAEPVNVAAKYESVPAETSAQSSTTTTQTETSTAAQATTPATPAESQNTTASAANQNTTAAAPAENQNVTPQQPAQETTATAQATAPAAPTPAPADSSADRSAQTATTTDTATNNANRTPRMPDTAANWVMMLLGGGMLSGAGLALRRR